MAIYRRLRKRRGRAKILANIVVTLSSGLPCKLVFIRDKTNGDWLALLLTDIALPDEDIVRIYGKRWDIEVFFKMIKQHLRLAKEGDIEKSAVNINYKPSHFFETLTWVLRDGGLVSVL
jgi:IS4 transposase